MPLFNPPPLLFLPPLPRGGCSRLCRPGVSCPHLLVPGGLCVIGACFCRHSGAPRVSVVSLCARALAMLACSPPPGYLRALFARSTRRVLVGLFQEDRAPRVFCSSFLFCLSWVGGGAVWSSRLPSCFLLVLTGFRGWALSPSRPPILWACRRDPRTFFLGCEGCGCGGRSLTLQRALLRAGVARCAGSKRAPEGGGSSCLSVGGLWICAHPPLAACFVGRLSACAVYRLWLRVCGRGDSELVPCLPSRSRHSVLCRRLQLAQEGSSPRGEGRLSLGAHPPLAVCRMG